MRHLLLLAPLLLIACGEKADLPVSAGQGSNPTLPAPKKTLLPTVNFAKVVGWAAGEKPTPAPGLAVAPFASGLVHPRWLYTLPNGDVLVAETNGPPRPEDEAGFMGKVAKFVMARAGATVPSANRITLLRDTNGDGIADVKTPFLTGLYSPFGMVLVGNDLFVAEADKLTRFAYVPGANAITTPGFKLADLPGGLRNHHWTKNVVAAADGKTLLSRSAPTPTSPKTAWRSKRTAPISSPSMPPPGRQPSLPPACATPSAWRGTR